jgi:hypothetical protein
MYHPEVIEAGIVRGAEPGEFAGEDDAALAANPRCLWQFVVSGQVIQLFEGV